MGRAERGPLLSHRGLAWLQSHRMREGDPWVAQEATLRQDITDPLRPQAIPGTISPRDTSRSSACFREVSFGRLGVR
jgi:hypothetical protein